MAAEGGGGQGTAPGAPRLQVDAPPGRRDRAGMSDDPRRVAPAAARNRDPILAVLRGVLPARGLVLEVASGTGEHCAHFAAALPGLEWQPTDLDDDNRASIDAWCAGLPHVRPALALDATASAWPVPRADAVVCINMIHIAPWAATPGLLHGAARLVPAGAPLVLYGPFRRAGVPTAPSNEEFDASLRARDPAWGLRALEDVGAEAVAAGFGPPEVVEMPANNLTVVFRRR
jgi:SAM-dependent methyltransferase